MTENELKTDVLRLLEILPPTDRDLKSITVCSNPNYEFGSDIEVSDMVSKVLDNLILEGIIEVKPINLEIFKKNSIGNLKRITQNTFSFIKNT